jgi:signal transduction histidine kinase
MNKRLKEVNIYKDNLLATVTHDLKTPINGMLSLLESSL